MDQPKVTDFTKVERTDTDPSGPLEFTVSVKLDSGWVTVAKYADDEDAEKAELAINQAMIEYRTKKNAWKQGMIK